MAKLTENDKNSGDLMTLDDFMTNCKLGGFIDDDGFGYAVAGEKINRETRIWPSERKNIPAGTTHILWFNR